MKNPSSCEQSNQEASLASLGRTAFLFVSADSSAAQTLRELFVAGRVESMKASREAAVSS